MEHFAEKADYGVRLGTLLVFALILPGVVASMTSGILFALNFFQASLWLLIVYIFSFGFLANVFGHYIDLALYRNPKIYTKIYPRLFPNKKAMIFEGFPSRVYKIRDPVNRGAAEYHFAWFCFMWNSGTAIMGLLILKAIMIVLSFTGVLSLAFSSVNHTTSLFFFFFLVTSLLCFYLADFHARTVLHLAEISENT